MEKEDFIKKAEKKGKMPKSTLKIDLRYKKEESGPEVPAILGVRRISTPGQRIYKKAKDMKLVKGGYGIAIISTPKGLMTNRQARKQKLGGEMIVEIW